MYRPAFFDDNFFNDFLGFPEKQHSRREPDLIHADVLESADGYQLELELPGYTKEDISIKLEDGYLSVAASRKNESQDVESQYKYIRRERHFGSCARRFYVGKNLNQDEIKARFENGILTLRFPKEDNRKAEAAKYINID